MSTSPASTSDGVLSYVMQHKFRAFLLLSVAAHLAVGVGWGVPAYVREQHRKETERKAALEATEDKKRAEAQIDTAKKGSFDAARQDVIRQLRKTFDTLVRDLADKRREQLWTSVLPSLSPPVDALAAALGDTSVTEHDLRNLQADLNRQLVERLNDHLARLVAQWQQEDYLHRIETIVIPAMQSHYRQALDKSVGPVLRDAGRAFVGKDAAKRIALATAVDPSLDTIANKTFGEAFTEHAAARIAGKAIAQLKRSLDETVPHEKMLIDSARSATLRLFAAKLLAVNDFGPNCTGKLKEITGATPPQPEDTEAVASGSAFVTSVSPAMTDKIIAVAKDDSFDAKLLEKVIPAAMSQRDEDIQYRVETMAANAAAGRTVSGLDGLTNTDFTQMRESALTRSTDISTMQSAIDQGIATTLPATLPEGAPGTQPAVDPILEAAMADVWDALKKDYNAIVKDRITSERDTVLWQYVKSIADPDVEKFTRDLLNPAKSRAEVEQARIALSVRFVQLVREALEIEIARTMADELVKKIEGEGGDKIAEAYADSLKKTVGEALTTSINDGAAGEKKSAEQAQADLKKSLDEIGTLATADLKVVTSIRDRFNKNKKEPLGDAPATLSSLAPPMTVAGDAVAKASGAGVFRLAETKPKLEAVVNEAKAVAESLEAMGKMTVAADIGKASGAPHAGLTRLSKAIKDAQTALTAEAVEAMREYASAAKTALTGEMTQPAGETTSATEAGPDSDAGAAKAINDELNKQIAAGGAVAAAGDVMDAFDEQLRRAGLAKTQVADDVKDRVAEAVKNKVADTTKTGSPDTSAPAAPPSGASAGEIAIAGTAKAGALKEADKAAGTPSSGIVEKVQKRTEEVISSGVKQSVAGGVPSKDAVANAVKSVAGPDKPTKDFRGELSEMERAAQTGHGGVLNGGGSGTTVAELRGKWLGDGNGAVAAGEGSMEGAGVGNAGETASGSGSANAGGAGAAGAGTTGAGAAAGGAGAGSGRGTGTGSGSGGSGSGSAAVTGLPGGNANDGRNTVRTSQQKIDEERYAKTAGQIAGRGNVRGDPWDRAAATGDARRDRDDRALAAAMVVGSALPPNLEVKGGEPYTPAFQTIRFMPVSYLTRPFKIDGDFKKWEDIPAFDLLPEMTGAGAKVENPKIAESIKGRMAWDGGGIFFMFDVVDANGKLDLAPGADNFFMADVVEVWIDTLNLKERRRARGAGQQFWAWPFGSATNADAPGGESIKDRTTAYMKFAMTPAQMQRAAQKTPDGYRIEFRLPVERLRDPQLVAGKILGLNMTIETGGGVHYYWSSSKAIETFERPDTWGDALLAGSDGKLEIPKALSSETVGAKTDETMTTFIIGQPLRLRVTDRDMDLNDRFRDKVSVTVRNSAGESEVAILEETGPSTGIFEGAVRTMLSIGERIPASLGVTEGESITVTYIDQARANGARNAELIYKVKPATVVTGK